MTYILDQLAYFITHFIGQFGYFGVVFLMTLESANIPIPSEVIMPFAGFLVARGDLSLFWVVVFGTLGNWIGSVISYAIGYYGGRPLVLKYGKYVRLNEHHLDQSEVWFSKYGEWSVFIGRLLPIVRTFISLPAGFSKMNYAKFSLYTVLGAFPFCYLLGWLGYKMGEHWEDLRQYFHYLDYLIILVIILLIIRYFMKKRSHK